MCLKFKAHNTHSEYLLHEQVLWCCLCNKEYIQHNASPNRVHTLMLYWTFVVCYYPVHVGVKNERDLNFAEFFSIYISQECLCSEPNTDCSL